MGMFDIFSQGQKQAAAMQQAPQQQPVQQQSEMAPPGNIQDPATVAAQSNVADAPATAPADGLPKDSNQEPSLDQFKDLWDTSSNTTEQPKPQQVLTRDKVAQAVAKTDFSQAVTAEQLQAISMGGEDATKAFAQAMNNVAQQVMVQATLVNDRISQQKLAQTRKEFEAAIPEMLRKQGAANHLKESNPIFSNPAIQPVVQATQQQLLQKYPNATQAELTKMTNDYILAMGQAFAPAPAPTAEADTSTDWDKFLS